MRAREITNDKPVLLHGTNHRLQSLLPPSITANQREARKGNLSVVFATPNLTMAKNYAYTAVKQSGGEPVILIVDGDFKPWKNKPGCTIFIAPEATAVGEVKFERDQNGDLKPEYHYY